MNFKANAAPRRTARQYSRSEHQKKSKRKRRQESKYMEETPQVSAQEFIEKTISSLRKLGIQIFALSPYSQYYDDWLINLHQVLIEFENNQTINIDEEYRKQQAQSLRDIEGKLAEKRLQESNLSAEAKALSDINHQIADADKEYAEKNREQNNKRNTELQRLSAKIREIEEQQTEQEKVKISFFKFKEKRAASQTLLETQQNVIKAKKELEVILANFTAEQEKLHDSYQKRKQELGQASDELHKKLEKLEIDSSIEDRKIACSALIDNINNLLERKQPQTS